MKQKIIFLFLIALISCSFNSSKSEKRVNNYADDTNSRYLLKWKLQYGEFIGYRSSVELIEQSEVAINFDLKEDVPFDEINKILEQYQTEFDKTKYNTTLNKVKSGDIEIKMFSEDFKDKPGSFLQGFNPENLMKGVVLRGLISELGKITSFYLQNNQKNLIALFFELPGYRVNIGDKWELDVNFLQFDQTFICENFERNNEVKFQDLRVVNGDSIAILKYNIYEYADGIMKNPLNNKKVKSSLKMRFTGIAEFSLIQGKWINYHGIIETDQTGMMNASSKQSLFLVPLDEVTDKMKEIE